MLTRLLLMVLVIAIGIGFALAEETDPKTTIVTLGLTDHKVDEAELLERKALVKPTKKSGGVAYGWVAHAKKGDRIEVHLKKDGASLMNNVREVTEDDTDVLLQAGKLGVPAGGWPDGLYTSKVTVMRGDETIGEQESDPIPFE